MGWSWWGSGMWGEFELRFNRTSLNCQSHYTDHFRVKYTDNKTIAYLSKDSDLSAASIEFIL